MKRSINPLLLTFFFFLLFPIFALAGEINEEEVKTKLPNLLGANNVGKEFWFSIPPCYEETYGNNFIRLYVTSPYRTLVIVESPGKGLYRQKMTIPNDVIEFQISPQEGQPYTKRPSDKEVPDNVYPGFGLHVYANDPIVVYAVVRFRYTSDGFLAIPVSSLGKEYIVAGYPVDPMFKAVWNYPLPNICVIVAPYDQTKVRFTLGGNSITKTAGGLRPGQTVEKTLNRGDVFVISTEGDASDLTGSRVVANKPVAVVTGNQCTNIPNGNQWCDYTVEMDLPTYTWGKDYHIPNTSKIPMRAYSPLLRIFAKEKNTTLYRDGQEFAFLKSTTGTEGNGWLETRMNPVMVPKQHYPVVISGDKPIGVTLYNPGVQEDQFAGLNPNSDPFVMVITPLQQYQKEITFCTPATFGGARFAENYIGLVYEADSLGMCPDDLEFAEVKAGQFVWKKIKILFPGVDDLYRYDVDGKKFAYKVIPLARDGVYKIRAKKPFAAYSYGFDSYDSYGYPTSAALADLEKPDTLPPVPRWRDSCGIVSFATVTDMPDDPAIRSNMAMVVLHPYPESFNVKLTVADFIPGETRTVPWKLEVVDLEQDARAVITFSDRRGNDTTITIEYSAVKLAIRPGKEDWGLRKFGSGRSSREFWVINENERYGAMIKYLRLKSGNKHFEIDYLGRGLPFWLGPKDSVKILVWFEAVEVGSFADSIGVGDTCVFSYKARVEASVGEPTIEVSDINFGTVTVGRTVAKDFTIKNNGTTDLHIWGYSGPANVVVYKTNLPPVDANNRLAEEIVIKPGAEELFTVTFMPEAEIEYPDAIVFFSDADRTDSVCVIYGRGIRPGLESNSYNWGRRRIDRVNHPAGPYNVEGGDVIKLTNTGTQEVHISGLIVVEDKNGEAFEFDRGIFNNLTIEAGRDTVIPVVFHPVQVGEHRLRLRFENTANSTTETILEGIGIVGRLKTVDIEFDPMVVFDVGNEQRKTTYIENEEYEWSDSVTITELVVTPAGSIAEDGKSYGSEGFGYDKARVGLPIVLRAGEKKEIEGYFVAQKVERAEGEITTVSDAEREVTTKWTGSGISRGISVQGGSIKICVGDIGEVSCEISNPALGDLVIDRLTLNGEIEGISYKDPADALGFTLKPGERREVRFIYMPNKVEKKRVWVMIPNNTLERPLDSVAIDFEAVQYSGKSRVNIIKPNINRAWPTVGDAIGVEITFNTAEDLTLAQAKRIRIVVRYNGGVYKMREDKVSIGSMLEGRFSIKETKIDDIKGEMEVVIESNGVGILNGSGQVLKFQLDAYLPTVKDSTDWSRIEVDMEAEGTRCIVIEDEGAEIKLQPVCVYDMRWIAVSETPYNLSEVKPNPVVGGVVEVSFGVGFEGWTEISIYNAKGEKVKEVVRGRLPAGTYEVKVDISDLGNGVYMIVMQSGNYRQTGEFTISR